MKPNEVWILVNIATHVTGHGETGKSVEVVQQDAYSTNTPYPAFTSESAANTFIKGIKYGCYSMKPYLLEVQSNQNTD
jgi:hypothetical protein